MSLRTLARAAAVVAILAAPLGACGKLGTLEKPGSANRASRGADRQAGDQTSRPAQDPLRPPATVDPRDRDRDVTTDPAPPRTLPIPGSGQQGVPPAGALPNPYNNPR